MGRYSTIPERWRLKQGYLIGWIVKHNRFWPFFDASHFAPLRLYHPKILTSGCFGLTRMTSCTNSCTWHTNTVDAANIRQITSKCIKTLQGGPLLVIHGVVTPIDGLIHGYPYKWSYNYNLWLISCKGPPCTTNPSRFSFSKISFHHQPLSIQVCPEISGLHRSIPILREQYHGDFSSPRRLSTTPDLMQKLRLCQDICRGRHAIGERMVNLINLADPTLEGLE